MSMPRQTCRCDGNELNCLSLFGNLSCVIITIIQIGEEEEEIKLNRI